MKPDISTPEQIVAELLLWRDTEHAYVVALHEDRFQLFSPSPDPDPAEALRAAMDRGAKPFALFATIVSGRGVGAEVATRLDPLSEYRDDEWGSEQLRAFHDYFVQEARTGGFPAVFRA